MIFFNFYTNQREKESKSNKAKQLEEEIIFNVFYQVKASEFVEFEFFQEAWEELSAIKNVSWQS